MSNKSHGPKKNDKVSDGVRRKYKYRSLAIHGRLKIPARLVMKMVGPDCAYQLYSQLSPTVDSKDVAKPELG